MVDNPKTEGRATSTPQPVHTLMSRVNLRLKFTNMVNSEYDDSKKKQLQVRLNKKHKEAQKRRNLLKEKKQSSIKRMHNKISLVQEKHNFLVKRKKD